MLDARGFEFITFDLEHEAYGESALVHHPGGEAFELTPIVRVSAVIPTLMALDPLGLLPSFSFSSMGSRRNSRPRSAARLSIVA